MVEYTVRGLVNDFIKGHIHIPIFQREFVWSDYQIVTLAESIYKGYPIGIMIFYEWSEEGKKQYRVLDGQQRLLSMVLMSEERVQIEAGERRLIIWFNVRTEEFKASMYKPGDEWVRLKDVITKNSSKEVVEVAQEISRKTGISLGDVLEKLNRLWAQFNTKEYTVPVFIVPGNTDLDTLGEIFVRINFAGTRVRSADVNYTMLAIVNEEVAKLMRKFYHSLANAQLLGYEWDLEYGVIVRTFIAFLSEGRVRLENTVLKQAKTLKELLREKKDELMNIWDLTRNSLLEAIKFLMDDDLLAIKSSKSRFLLTQTPLITMAYYIGSKYLINHIPVPHNEKLGLIGWFILSTYYRRYSSASETRLNEDLQAIAEGGNYKDLISNLKKHVGELRISEEAYRGTGTDKLFLLYVALRSTRARDFYDRETVINGLNATTHHIFPINIIGGMYSRNEINDIANLTLILSSSNERIRESPKIYLKRIPHELLQAHLIPLNEELWEERRFKDFLEERRKLLVNTINAYLSKLDTI